MTVWVCEAVNDRDDVCEFEPVRVTERGCEGDELCDGEKERVWLCERVSDCDCDRERVCDRDRLCESVCERDWLGVVVRVAVCDSDADALPEAVSVSLGVPLGLAEPLALGVEELVRVPDCVWLGDSEALADCERDPVTVAVPLPLRVPEPVWLALAICVRLCEGVPLSLRIPDRETLGVPEPLGVTLCAHRGVCASHHDGPSGDCPRDVRAGDRGDA